MKTTFRRYVLMVLSCLALVSCSGRPGIKTEAPLPKDSIAAALTDQWRFGNEVIAYHKSGSGAPMVFLHNGGTDHRIWDYQVRYFSKNHTVYALDLPGFGESGHPKTPYTLDFYTLVLEGFIKDNAIVSPVIVGNCIGSATALNYARRNPENVNKLILFNILTDSILREGAYGYWHGVSRIYGGKSCLGFFSPFVWMPNFYITSHMKKLYGSRGLAGEPDPLFLDHLRELFKKDAQLPSLTRILVNIKSYEAIAKPPENGVLPPTCVFWGEKNQVLPSDQGKLLCNAYAFKEFHVIEGAGHLLMREEHEKINSMMEAFISGESEEP